MTASAVRNLRVIFTAAFLNGTHNAMTRALLVFVRESPQNEIR